MDKSFRKQKMPSIDNFESDNLMSTFTKWAPLICAGSAIGLSIFVLSEMKKTKSELILIKKQDSDPMLYKKMELMEKQLKTITEYLKNNNSKNVVKNIVPEELPKEINIINF